VHNLITSKLKSGSPNTEAFNIVDEEKRTELEKVHKLISENFLEPRKKGFSPTYGFLIQDIKQQNEPWVAIQAKGQLEYMETSITTLGYANTYPSTEISNQLEPFGVGVLVMESQWKQEIQSKLQQIYKILISEDPDESDLNTAIISEKNYQKEKEVNTEVYNKLKDVLYTDYLGQYVVIAKGELQDTGDSFDAIKDAAMDANHRFIFKVEPKEKVKGKLRWPMKKKR